LEGEPKLDVAMVKKLKMLLEKGSQCNCS